MELTISVLVLLGVIAAVALAALAFVSARRATDAAAGAAAQVEALSAAVAQMSSVMNGLAQHAASSAALDQERFEAQMREFSRVEGKMDDVRRELNVQLRQSRESVGARLAEMREDNNRQLDRMRETVDEKLQTTLERRLARSFAQVSNQLEAVYKGLGDMQGIAAGVGDLKRVLGNVKTRGMLGEVQLGAILSDILAPDQYVKNVATKPGSAERVEFAVRIPVDGSDPVLLPIDAKFPGDTYEHLRDAVEAGDADAVAAARRTLVQRIRQEAKDISEKYLSVPQTTNVGIMFLPFEGLYAEVVDTPGLIEELQRDYQVSVAGPSTMAAILNSLQMSYQTFAFQRQADEIQRVLSAVKAELPRYQAALQRAYDQISRAGSTVETLMTTRTRAMERKLRGVTALGDEHEAARLLGIEGDGADELIVEEEGGEPEPLGAHARERGEGAALEAERCATMDEHDEEVDA